MRTITREATPNRKAIIRIDTDVPLDENKKIKDITRLEAVIPTFKLIRDSASQIIILGHLGRPEGKVDPNLSLAPVAQKLSELLNENVKLVQNVDEALNTQDKFVMLENLRFNPAEEANDPTFAQQLASLGDLFIFEAFAVAHRTSASTTGITEYISSYAGLRVTKEIEELSAVLTNPLHPFLVIIGGSKIETKLPVINNMLEKADTIFVAGKLPSEIVEKNMTFPEKVIIAQMNQSGLDISVESQQQISRIIRDAGMIVWNGPPGKFEDILAQQGTQIVAQAVAASRAKTIIGGGETNEAAKQFHIQDKIYFVSVGGGAMLEFLSGKTLPALEALNK